jgi:hypothetical protein
VNQAELTAALAASPSPDRVTPEYLQSRIARADYFRPTETLTICVITLDNGFTLTGESACADPANYREDIGQKIAYDMAERKIWPLLGFALKEAMAARERADIPPDLEAGGFVMCRSHKVVEAAIIRAAEFNEDGSGKVAIRLENDETRIVSVPAGFVRPGHVPEEGDVLVRYQPDGYLSWSPRSKFDNGYTAA